MENFTFETSTHGQSVDISMINISSEEQKMSTLKHLDESMTRAVLPVSILVGIGTVVGFFGNIMVIYVFVFHYKPCNFRIFVLCLGVVDLLSAMTTMSGEVITQTHWYTYPNAVICKIKTFCNTFTVTTEAMTLLFITIDRYLKACRPHGMQISIKAAKSIVIVIFLVAAVIAVPDPVFWGTHTQKMVYENIEITVTICETDQKFINRNEQVIYSFFMQGIICFIMVIMLVLCLLITRTLVARSKQVARNLKPLQAPKIDAIKVFSGKEDFKHKASKSIRDERNVGEAPDMEHGQSNPSLDLLKVETNADENICAQFANSSTSFIIEKEKNVQSQSNRREDDQQRTKTDMIIINTKAKTMRRVRSKTVVMFVLTLTFIVTTVLYLTLVTYLSKGILKTLSDKQKPIFFLFFRLYFINHVINPIIYGALDHRFQTVFISCWRIKVRKFFQNA